MASRTTPVVGATLWEMASARADVTPDRIMFHGNEHRPDMSFRQFVQRCEQVAAGFLDLGIGADTAVSWQLPTRVDSAVVMLALARLDARQNPLIPLYREREVRSVLRQTAPKWLLVPRQWRAFDHEAMARSLAAEVGSLEVMVVDDGLPEGDAADLPPAPTGDEAIRYIYSTSGTTAEPKCVLHRDRSLIAAGVAMNEALGLGPDDSGCLPVPIAHPGGFSYLVAVFQQGFPSTFVDPWSIEEAVTLMNRHGATVMGGSTAHFTMLLAEQRKDPSTPLIPTVRMFTGGGAALPAETFRQINDELGVRPAYGYGMTECPTIAMGSPRDTDEQLAETAGRLSEGLEVRVVGPDDQPVADDEEGEVELRGPMCFAGYADAALTLEAFSPDGWFRTGDRGRIRPDRHIVLTGRSKDVIIRKGENISPLEVEAIMLLVPGVAATAVIGLPDADRGERVCAVIELVAGASAPSLDDVRRVCDREGLMIQKVPEQLEVIDTFPRNATLKILKHELRARYASNSKEG